MRERNTMVWYENVFVTMRYVLQEKTVIQNNRETKKWKKKLREPEKKK